VPGFSWFGMAGARWDTAATLAIRTLPLLFVVAALVPALVHCPFLGAEHRRWLLSVLAQLRTWAIAPLGGAARAVPAAPGLWE
jgi:hypothetical protein